MSSAGSCAPAHEADLLPTFSVVAVVVAFNGHDDILPCLRSLIPAGTTRDVVVVDNGSTDGTTALVQRHFPGVRLLVMDANLGYGGATNAGIAASDADYIVVLNQDVVCLPGCIDRLVAALHRDPGAAMATPKILLKDRPGRINTCGNQVHYTGLTTCRGYGLPADALSTSETVAAVSGALFAIRRSAFVLLGGFDPRFFMYLEDTDLSVRALLAGYRCLYVPEAEVLHDFSPSFTPGKLFWLERNRIMLLMKLYRWRTLALLAPALLLTEGAVWAYTLLRGPRCMAAKVRAWWWIARHIRPILHARRRAQSARTVGDDVVLGRCAAHLDLGELSPAMGAAAQLLVNPFYRGWHRFACWGAAR